MKLVLMNVGCALLIVLTACAPGCGDDDSETKCERAAQVLAGAMDDFCEQNVNACCFCACWEAAYGSYDIEDWMASKTCTCETPTGEGTTQDGTPPCEGNALAAAEECLADTDACAQPQIDATQLACDASAF